MTERNTRGGGGMLGGFQEVGASRANRVKAEAAD